MKKNKQIISFIIVVVVLLSGILIYKNKDKQVSNSNKTQVKDDKNSTNTSNNTTNTSSNSNDKKENITYKSVDSEKEALKAVEKLVKITYFKEETYEDYKALFTNPEKALSKEKFENFRKTSNVKDKFKYDYESIDGIMKHMKTVKDNKNMKVYYLKDVNSKEGMEDASYWKLVEKDGKVLIRNDGL